MRRIQFYMAIGLGLLSQIATAGAQSGAAGPAPEADSLTLEQQLKVSPLITKDAGTPLPVGEFQLAIGSAVPTEIQLHPVPKTAGDAAPQIRGRSYVAVEEQIAIVDPKSRKITAVLQRGKNGGR